MVHTVIWIGIKDSEKNSSPPPKKNPHVMKILFSYDMIKVLRENSLKVPTNFVYEEGTPLDHINPHRQLTGGGLCHLTRHFTTV